MKICWICHLSHLWWKAFIMTQHATLKFNNLHNWSCFRNLESKHYFISFSWLYFGTINCVALNDRAVENHLWFLARCQKPILNNVSLEDKGLLHVKCHIYTKAPFSCPSPQLSQVLLVAIFVTWLWQSPPIIISVTKDYIWPFYSVKLHLPVC